MKKILILSNSSSGLFEFRNEIILDMMRDCEVFISLPDRDRYYSLLEDEGCHMVHTQFERRGMNPLEDIKLYREYKKLIRDIRPDIVCTYTIKPNIYGGMACKMTRTPYVVNITGLGTAIQGGGLISRILICMYRFATSRAEVVFFQNQHNKDFMVTRGIGKRTNDLLPGSGVNIDLHNYTEYPSEQNSINILSVLRIMRDKGIEEYLAIVDRIGGKKISEIIEDKVHLSDCIVNFVLAGDYEEETRSKYEPIINRLVAENKLSYLGFVDDMDSQYATCHIIVHPSYHEGMSNVCLEASANGRMVLASNIPGCMETIEDGRTGYLFEPKSVESIYSAIINTLKLSADEREKAGQLAREYVVNHFDRKIVINKYRELIERI